MTKADRVEINVQARKKGKHHSRTLRKNRYIPAVVYGPKMQNLNLSLEEKDVIKYASRKYANAIFVLKSDEKGLNNLQVLRKDLTIHPVSRRPIHLDFYALDMTQTVHVKVAIRYEGKSIGEKEGGVFNAVRHEVEVECLPTEIPEQFTFDISELKMHDVVHVSDLKLPENVKMISGEDLTIATVSEPAPEEEVVPVAAAEGAEGEAAAGGGEAKTPAEGEGGKKSE